MEAEAATPPPVPRPSIRLPRRWVLWGALVILLLVAQTLLVALTISYESSQTQEAVDLAATEAAVDVKRELLRGTQSLQALLWAEPMPTARRDGAAELLRTRRALIRIELREPDLRVATVFETPFEPRPFVQMPRSVLEVDTHVACAAARHSSAPMFSRTYFVPMASGQGIEVIDVCIPLPAVGGVRGFLVGTFALPTLLDSVLSPRQARQQEVSFVEADGTRLARAGGPRGAGVYVAERVVDLPGVALQLRADSAAGRPSLIPNLTTALVLGLSIALFGVVLLLARDVRRRAGVERALADALAFRKAMEDSLVTGLRARDMDGSITYVNPAFCAMVGWSAEELRGQLPPYWPPERARAYAERQSRGERPELREGHETVFMRKNGERFPVMVYEAPLVDRLGRQTGWMSAVLDLSAQRRVEELSRQQQDRLQATARLATVGEMASLLSHELNQPLSAIASYASGSLNVIDAPDDAGPGMAPLADKDTRALLTQALERIAEQAERAGRIIKSVHDFVRRREQHRETIAADLLIDAVMPLVRLQARKCGARIEIDIPTRAPRVVCDRTMIEQVLLNLTRNGIQAMEADTPLEARVLTIRVRPADPRWVAFSVIDGGHGIPGEVAAQLFTPFFTTRPEGMGLGLSLCRTVIEQHGGVLDFAPAPQGAGTEFRFTLPAPRVLDAEPGAPADAGAAGRTEGVEPGPAAYSRSG